MTPEEAQGLVEGLAELVAEGNVRAAEAHAAISQRVFGLLPGTRPVQVAHDVVAAGVYATVAVAAPVAGAMGGLAARSLRDHDAPSLRGRPRANSVLAAVDGAVGDHLAATDNAIASGMVVRHDGRDVPLRRGALADAFPDASGRVVVWLHGLCEAESIWRVGGRRHHDDPEASHPRRVDERHGTSSVVLRYNTGLRVLANGRALDRLLDDLVAAWPVEVHEIVLVGHSMGGLVVRSAALLAQDRRRPDRPTWLARTRRIVCLGTPHHGAPLERAVNRLNANLLRVGEAAWVARLLNRRSVGIKDLRHGSVADEWVGSDPDAVLGDLRNPDRADLDGVDVHAIVATLGRRSDDAVSRLAGDGLVWFDSGTGEGAFPVRMASVHHVARASHFDLFNHPDAIAALDAVLGRPALPG